MLLPFSKRSVLDLIQSNLPTSRSEAIDKKSTRYFTGEPCKHGHVSDRVTSTGGCCECLHGARVPIAASEPSDTPENLRYKYNVFPCMLERKADWKHCPTCVIRSEAFDGEPCRGRDCRSLLTRVTLAFAHRRAIPRQDAVAMGMAVYKSAERCGKCGYHSWKTVASGKCGICELEAARAAQYGADWKTRWIAPESMSEGLRRAWPEGRRMIELPEPWVTDDGAGHTVAGAVGAGA